MTLMRQDRRPSLECSAIRYTLQRMTYECYQERTHAHFHKNIIDVWSIPRIILRQRGKCVQNNSMVNLLISILSHFWKLPVEFFEFDVNLQNPDMTIVNLLHILWCAICVSRIDFSVHYANKNCYSSSSLLFICFIGCQTTSAWRSLFISIFHMYCDEVAL